MKRAVLTLTIAAAVLGVPCASSAQVTVALNFDSLPSAQGWTYFQGSVPESSVFSVTGGVLTQNTIGTGFGNGNPNYALFNVVDGAQPFVLRVRARVPAIEGSHGGFRFTVRTAAPNQIYNIFLTPSDIYDGLNRHVAFDNTSFHDYVLTATPGGAFLLYVDGQLRFDGPFSPFGGSLNGLQLGDGGDLDGNAYAEVSEFVFSQPATFTPPPVVSCAQPGFLPPFDVPIALKRQQQRAIPVKMMVRDAAGSLLGDSDIAAPVVSVDFNTGAEAAIDMTSELLPLGQANVDNVFRFEASTSTWVYNLSTKFFSNAGTYRVVARAGDQSYLVDASCAGSFVRLP